ncbi:MAG TPA: sodium:proton antiporter [Candidatus Wallbacteria bacterium]|nr:MAG: Citrate transporter [bacterium ADurb.Bin243]HPG56685.1 sodium:proton antiporter [Candidatus Wallbacteria bacterium]
MSGSKVKLLVNFSLFTVVAVLFVFLSAGFYAACATEEVAAAGAHISSATAEVAASAHSGGGHKVTYTVPPLLMIPFAALLLGIALMPFINKHFWEHNYPYVSYALGAFVVFYYLFAIGGSAGTKVLHTALEYISFIALIGSLFVVTGGIVIKLKNEGNPVINSAVLFIGSILANIIGTTGASMLLIRPFIRINHRRIRPYLIMFFIFTISNVGGALTPIGDPPLFLGYLQGVPFFWVIENVIQMWGVALFLIISIFFAVDYFYFSKDKMHGLEKKAAALAGHAAEHKSDETVHAAEKKESKKKKHHKKHEEEDDGILPDEDESLKFKLLGVTNFLFLFIILVAVFLPTPWREIIMLGCAVAAYKSTPAKNHIENGFNFEPIREVAILFVGIFATMMPALDWLEANAASLGIRTPGQFYWGSGVLSSFLDNAPTYLNFLSAAKGLNGVDHVSALLATPALSQYVIAISLGSVFFGAMTYIGNGPNFMVKNISEQMNVKMPSFFGYVFLYSLPVLIPVFALVWAIFLR